MKDSSSHYEYTTSTLPSSTRGQCFTFQAMGLLQLVLFIRLSHAFRRRATASCFANIVQWQTTSSMR